MTGVTVVVGNPRPQSRTLAVANRLGARIGQAVGASGEPAVVDLAEHAPRIFERDDPTLDEITKMVAGSRVCVFASPTYKATYSGLLKSFLDRYGDNGLAGVVAVPMMMGAGPGHALAPEVHLRPLLVELGALVPSRGLYVMESQLDDVDAVIGNWLETAAGPLGSLIR
ncbi:MAG: NADPH-dependent FMN reductase [Acidimicrobiia bacterium]